MALVVSVHLSPVVVMVVMVLVSPHALVTPAYTHHLGRLVCQLHSPALTETTQLTTI